MTGITTIEASPSPLPELTRPWKGWTRRTDAGGHTLLHETAHVMVQFKPLGGNGWLVGIAMDMGGIQWLPSVRDLDFCERAALAEIAVRVARIEGHIRAIRAAVSDAGGVDRG